MKSGWADTVLSEMYMSYCGVPTKPQPLTQWGRYTFIHASCGFLLTFQKKHLVFWLLCQTGWPPTLSVCQFESRHSLRKQLLSRSLSAVHSQVAVHLWRVVICGRIWWSRTFPVPVDHVGPWKTHMFDSASVVTVAPWRRRCLDCLFLDVLDVLHSSRFPACRLGLAECVRMCVQHCWSLSHVSRGCSPGTCMWLVACVLSYTRSSFFFCYPPPHPSPRRSMWLKNQQSKQSDFTMFVKSNKFVRYAPESSSIS